MKKILITTLFIALYSFSQAQYMSDYFKYKGIKSLALLAHPTNTFKTGRFEIYSDKVWVKIIYEDYKTVLEIERENNFFTDIRVLNDNDWVTPFAGIEIIKNIAYEALEDEDEDKSKIEKRIGKAFSDMTGIEMACLILTLEWWNY